MGVETSTKKTEPSDKSNMVFAIGKRKGESNGQALSLPDGRIHQVSAQGRFYKVERALLIEFC